LVTHSSTDKELWC